MKRSRRDILIGSTALAGSAVLPQSAQAFGLGLGNRFGHLGALGGAGNYIGPGDLVPGASAWWGLRAFSKATAGNNAVDVIRASDGTTITIKTLSNGALDVATLTAFLASTTGKVSKFYDQTGNGNDLLQGTPANQPLITLNAVGTNPALTFDGSATFMASSSSVTISQPYTLSTVAKTTVDATAVLLRASAGVQAFIDFAPTAMATINSGASSLAAPSSINTLHSLLGVFNNATSTISVDGVPVGGSIASTNDFTGNFLLGAASITPSFVLTGIITEAGIWPFEIAP